MGAGSAGPSCSDFSNLLRVLCSDYPFDFTEVVIRTYSVSFSGSYDDGGGGGSDESILSFTHFAAGIRAYLAFEELVLCMLSVFAGKFQRSRMPSVDNLQTACLDVDGDGGDLFTPIDMKDVWTLSLGASPAEVLGVLVGRQLESPVPPQPSFSVLMQAIASVDDDVSIRFESVPSPCLAGFVAAAESETGLRYACTETNSIHYPLILLALFMT